MYAYSLSFYTHTHTHILSTAPNITMKARYKGKCSECDEEIQIGKEIAKNGADKWVHKHCCAEELDLP